MSKWMMIGLLGCSVAIPVAGCNIENCEKGAYCGDGEGREDWEDDKKEEEELCIRYCDRASVCGAPQAKDFDDCVEACQDRFDALPEQTRDLCECTPDSRCEDVIDGRCTGSGGQGGGGGASATGGSPSHGGYPSTGGSSNNGGSPETGGSSNGGSPATGGSPSTGGASSTGGSPHTGGSHSTGGSTAGGSGGSDAGGAGGENPGTPCTCSCQCPSGQSCVSGYCSG